MGRAAGMVRGLTAQREWALARARLALQAQQQAAAQGVAERRMSLLEDEFDVNRQQAAFKAQVVRETWQAAKKQRGLQEQFFADLEQQGWIDAIMGKARGASDEQILSDFKRRGGLQPDAVEWTRDGGIRMRRQGEGEHYLHPDIVRVALERYTGQKIPARSMAGGSLVDIAAKQAAEAGYPETAAGKAAWQAAQRELKEIARQTALEKLADARRGTPPRTRTVRDYGQEGAPAIGEEVWTGEGWQEPPESPLVARERANGLRKRANDLRSDIVKKQAEFAELKPKQFRQKTIIANELDDLRSQLRAMEEPEERTAAPQRGLVSARTAPPTPETPRANLRTVEGQIADIRSRLAEKESLFSQVRPQKSRDLRLKTGLANDIQQLRSQLRGLEQRTAPSAAVPPTEQELRRAPEDFADVWNEPDLLDDRDRTLILQWIDQYGAERARQALDEVLARRGR